MSTATTSFPPPNFALPSTDLEEWRYSRVRDLDLTRFEPSTASLVATGAHVHALRDDPELEAALLDAIVGEAPDPFVDLNARFSADAVLVDVPAGAVVAEPIDVRHLVTSGGASFPRVIVRVGEDAEVTIVERSTDLGDDSLVVPVTELHVSRAARVRHIGVQSAPESVSVIGRVAADVAQDATVQLFHVALGGSYSRVRFDTRLVGRGATGTITALYLASRDQMHDLRTFQDHLAPDTTSHLDFKGAVDDRAHAVYTGLIRISEQGRGSNATQSNRIVKLSPEAWAESVPNLEIHHNDVRCAHASAVGPIDPDQRFYLESRGVRPDDAERLVVNGFFADVLAAIPDRDVAAAAAARISEELA